MLKEYLSTLADKFRSVLGTTEKINAQDFPDKVTEVYEKGYIKGDVDGFDKGVSAGKLELLTNSKYMNASLTNTAIAVNDVNEFTHSFGINLSSKNLLKKEAANPLNWNNEFAFDISALQVGSVYTFSSNKPITHFKISSHTGGYNCVQRANSNGFTEYTFTMGKNVNISETTNIYLFISILADTSNFVSDISQLEEYELQIEAGETATEYTPYVDDFSTVEVSRYGKNLLSPDIASLDNWVDASFHFSANSLLYYLNSVEGQQHTISFKTKSLDETVTDYGYLYMFRSNDNWQTSERVKNLVQVNVDYNPYTFTAEAGYEYALWWYSIYGKNIFEKYYDFQLEVGATATEYEPYIEPTTYTANADGTVEGVTSISPNMTLLTNNSDVVINANYLRDIDTYINNLIANVALTGGEA